MFTQAEFNPRRRLVCYALVSRYSNYGRGGFYRRPSRLVRFVCGDLAWDGGAGRISWPDKILICNVAGIGPRPRPFFDDMPRCDLPR